MAAVSSAQTTTTTLTPPSSSHGHQNATSWGHDDQQENGFDFQTGQHADYDTRSPTNGSFTSGAQMATRRMKSADNLSGDRWNESADHSTLLPPHQLETQNEANGTSGWRSRSPHKGKLGESTDVPTEEESKWIHRDKLAQIESRELQAAGLFIPRSRAPSKQSRRDRSRSQMRRGTDSSEPSRSRKNSTTVEQRALEVQVPSWDLRTPEEIAEEEANAYFTSNGLKGSSRIPVAKTSPAPIPLDYLERGSPATGRLSESPEGEPSMANKRSRSASASVRANENLTGSMAGGKRSNTDISPKKGPPSSRKMSSGAKSAVNQRPKTRSGSSGGTRPSTRSGESPPTKQPEGDPPWMVNSYKPDPRLPPDQQLLPTVARRLQQERWEKDGTYGDVYDKDFRPLNDKALPQQPENGQNEEDGSNDLLSPNGEWPLRPGSAGANKSPTMRQGSYSTMPKISDKAGANSPMASPRPQNTPQMFQPSIEPQSPAAQRVPEEKEGEKTKKGGCGCCIVM